MSNNHEKELKGMYDKGNREGTLSEHKDREGTLPNRYNLSPTSPSRIQYLLDKETNKLRTNFLSLAMEHGLLRHKNGLKFTIKVLMIDYEIKLNRQDLITYEVITYQGYEFHESALNVKGRDFFFKITGLELKMHGNDLDSNREMAKSLLLK